MIVDSDEWEESRKMLTEIVTRASVDSRRPGNLKLSVGGVPLEEVGNFQKETFEVARSCRWAWE